MDCLQHCVAGLCTSASRRTKIGRLGHFGEGLVETDGRADSLYVPDRLVLAEHGEPGPSNGKLGALAMAIGCRLAATEERRDVCLAVYHATCGMHAGPLLAEVAADLNSPVRNGVAARAVPTALAKLSLRQANQVPLEGVVAVVVAAGGKQLCPSLSLAEREVMAWHLKPQVPVHCIWMSDTGSGSRLRMWSSTVAALYPLPRPRPLVQLELDHHRNLYNAVLKAAEAAAVSDGNNQVALGVLFQCGQIRTSSKDVPVCHPLWGDCRGLS
ncbi:unnamed protein product [Cladocopium goreaui]|uniref:RNase H type-1 domain-containing protein n=1 Tax=Cladocopium goreaui TaxID=2562237 RepID=A0A9P1FLX7_9DINO|nr:unnamed protein product [Cladocopium goreaui]